MQTVLECICAWLTFKAEMRMYFRKGCHDGVRRKIQEGCQLKEALSSLFEDVDTRYNNMRKLLHCILAWLDGGHDCAREVLHANCQTT